MVCNARKTDNKQYHTVFRDPALISAIYFVLRLTLLTRSVAKVAYLPVSMLLNQNVEGWFDVVDMML
jgi:hypothetical protein